MMPTLPRWLLFSRVLESPRAEERIIARAYRESRGRYLGPRGADEGGSAYNNFSTVMGKSRMRFPVA